MIYTAVTVLLVVAILLYFRIADRYNIIDKPNERSSHSSVTIRGGGIIFPIAILLWFLFFGFQYPWFTLGLLLIAAISFLDDILTLSTKPRLTIHLLSVGLTLYELGFGLLPWWTWIVGFILIIGWLNTFNFMDGINGITVLYAISVFAPIYWINEGLGVVPSSMIEAVGLGLIVFGFYNVRKKAKTFSGDVGSISLGLIIAFLLTSILLYTGNWEYILFVAVYGIDSVVTILERLLRRENIFEAHRTHLYQYLANEKKVPHVVVSALYALVQLVISVGVIYLQSMEVKTIYFVSVFILSGIVYILIKTKIVKSIKSEVIKYKNRIE